MRLTELVAEWYYFKHSRGILLVPFDKQDSNTRDYYFRLAYQNIPRLISGYFRNGNVMHRLIRGCIQDFINAHGNLLTRQNCDSLARRIIANIRGMTLKNDNTSNNA